MKKKNKLILIGIVLLILFALYLSYGDGTCDISDTSLRAECYTSLAEETGDVSYCSNEAYYFDDCIDAADPNREASTDDLTEVCEAVTDSSRKEDCYQYIEENYSP